MMIQGHKSTPFWTPPEDSGAKAKIEPEKKASEETSSLDAAANASKPTLSKTAKKNKYKRKKKQLVAAQKAKDAAAEAVKTNAQLFQKAIEALKIRPSKLNLLFSMDGIETLISNSLYNPHALSLVSSFPTGGDVMLGISGMDSLNFLSLFNISEHPSIKYCIMVDLAPRVAKFWKKAAEVIRETQTRQATYEGLVKLLSRTKEFGAALSDSGPVHPLVLEKFRMEGEIISGRSWLSTEKRYRAVKAIFDNNCFAFKLMDLADPVAMTSMVNTLKTLKLKIGLVRLTNIHEYAEYYKFVKEFQKTMKILCTGCSERAIILGTYVRPGGSDPHNEKVSHTYPLSVNMLTLEEVAEPEKAFPKSPEFVLPKEHREYNLYAEAVDIIRKSDANTPFKPMLTLPEEPTSAQDKKEKNDGVKT